MKLTKENRSTRGKKPVPVPLCQPQTPTGTDPGHGTALLLIIIKKFKKQVIFTYIIF